MLLVKMAQTYISLSLGLAVVCFGARDLGGGVHFILQLRDFVCEFLQGLHDVGSLLGFHSSVLLQAVYQGLVEEGQAAREGNAQQRKKTQRQSIGNKK